MNRDVHSNPRWWKDHNLAMDFVARVAALSTFSYKAEQFFSEMENMVGECKSRTKMDVFENTLHINSTKRFTADVARDNDGVWVGNFQPKLLDNFASKYA